MLSAQTQEQLAAQETRTRARAFQLCIHCQQNPAGFWVRRTDSKVVHRPWCLSCCQELGQGRYDMTPFAV